MANRSLGTLTVDLVAKIGGFQQGMDQAARIADAKMRSLQERAYKFGENIGKAIKAGVIAISAAVVATTAAVRESINSMDEMSKSAQKIGTTTEQLSTLSYAAKLADVQISDLESASGRLTKSMGMAQNPITQQAKIFKALGIATLDASGKMRDSVSVLKDFADAFQKSGRSPEVMAAGLTLFGRQFQTLVPLLKDGSQGIADAQAEAKAFGLQLSTETGEQAENFNDNLTRLKSITEGIVQQLATGLLPILNQWSDQFVETSKNTDSLSRSTDALKGVLTAAALVANSLTIAFAAVSMVVKDTAVAIAASVRSLGSSFDILKSLATGDLKGAKQGMVDYQNGVKEALGTVGTNWKDFKKSLATDLNDMGVALGGFQAKQGKAAKETKDTGKEAEKWAAQHAKALQSALGNTVAPKSGGSGSVDKLSDAYGKLYEAVQKVQAEGDPSTKITQDYASRISQLVQLGAAAIKAGGNIVEIQKQVAAGTDALNKQMNFDLDAPARAVKEYTNSLDAQLAAQKQAMDVQVQSIGLSDKEAQNLQALAKIRFDGAQAITAFQQAHQLHPDAMSEKQYDEQLAAYEKYWDDLYEATKDGQARISAAESDWHTGVNKALADFMENQRNLAKQGYDFTTDLINGVGDAFVDIVDGAKSAKDAIGDLLDDLYRQALKFVANKAIQAMLDSFGKNGSGAAGSGGGWGGIISGIVGAFGGGKAIGGPVSAGSFYEVTEHGPEMLSANGRNYLMMGNTSGNVTPMRQSPAQSGTASPINVFVQPTSTRRTAEQVAVATARVQRIATARNG